MTKKKITAILVGVLVFVVSFSGVFLFLNKKDNTEKKVFRYDHALRILQLRFPCICKQS